MAFKIMAEKVSLEQLQCYQHSLLNVFSEQETLLEAVSNRVGFFGSNPVTYLSLIIRRPSIKRGDIEDAILNDKSLIRAGGCKGSLFLFSAQDYPLYYRALYQTLYPIGLGALERAGITTQKLKKCATALKEADFQLPQTVEQIIAFLPLQLVKNLDTSLSYLLMRKLCDLGVLVRVAAKGWKGNRFSYALMKNWLPEAVLKSEAPETARTEIIKRYLRNYGPATVEDVIAWTGLPASQVQRSVFHLRREIARIQIEGRKDEMLCLKESTETLKKNVDIPQQILFLPPWDPFLLGWQSCWRLGDKETLKYVYDSNKNSASAIVHRGKIVGLWQFRDALVNTLELHVLGHSQHLKKQILRQAEAYAMVLSELSGAKEISIFERELPQPLDKREKGAFLWPLGQEMLTTNSNVGLLRSPMDRRTANTFRHNYLDGENIVRPIQTKEISDFFELST